MGHAERIFAVSNHTAEILCRFGIEREKISVIPNGVTAEDFSDTEETERCKETVIKKYGLHGKRLLVTIARLVERKGHEKVLQALVEVRKQIPEVTYMIVGDGPLKGRLMELTSQLSLTDAVLFAGQVSEREKVGILHACDLFIMPNRDIPLPCRVDTEGFGIAFLEANACRKPVIGGKAGGAREAIEHGRTGLLVDPEDHIEIKEAVIRLLHDGRMARLMGETGRERVMQKFQWSFIAETYVKEFSRL
jgi:phosphatidylinositol alpha-1,6-mannosyltransferase